MKKFYNIFILSVIMVASLASCERPFLEPWPPDAARTEELTAKEKEVEEAFQAYLAGEQEENKASEEKQAAEGIDSVFSMNMSAE